MGHEKKTHLYDPICKRFQNPYLQKNRRTLKDALLWKCGYFDDPNEAFPMPKDFVPTAPKSHLNKNQPCVMWINHSTFFIQIQGIHILTDPIWGKRCSPLSFVGPIRKHVPPMNLEDLQQVDHVLISHDHYDHLDKQTVLKLHALYPNIHWWVPLGVKKWFLRLGITKVEECGWWESKSFSTHSMQLTAVPTQHFSGRSLMKMSSTLWLGWVVDFFFKGYCKRFYFVGDTGYNPFNFKEIGKAWPHMDLSLIPIGSYIPRKFMSTVHVDPFQAVQIHKEVNSIQSIGMHWGTFRLSDEELFRPPYDLFLAMQKEGLNPHTFLTLQPGHAINW